MSAPGMVMSPNSGWSSPPPGGTMGGMSSQTVSAEEGPTEADRRTDRRATERRILLVGWGTD